MKILIAVPTFENIQPEVFKAIYNLISEHELHFDYIRGYDCAIARNNIGKIAQAGDYDYVLMVDSDTLIPPDTIDLMLDPPVDVCMGVYPMKNTKDGKTTLVKLGSESYKAKYHYDDLPAERTRVKGGGFGCVLVKTSVFTTLDYPYFQYLTNEDWSVIGEDYYFCQNCEAFGIEIWVDPRIKCGHLTRYYQYE